MKLIPVAFLQRSRQKLGLDEPAIDEKYLHGAGAAAIDGSGHKARAPSMSPPRPCHRHQRFGEFPAQGGVDGGFQLAVSGGMEGLLRRP